MEVLVMEGPYMLTESEIESHLSENNPGSFALGRIDDDKNLVVMFVGRDDEDVQSELKDWIGRSNEYTHFKYSYASDGKDAFISQCENYHDFGTENQLDNEQHPQPPKGSDSTCPRCTKFD